MANTTHRHTLRIGLLVAALVLGVMVTCAWHTVSAFNASSAWVLHTQEVRYALGETMSQLKDVETGSRGFVIAGTPVFLESYRAGRAGLDKLLPKLNSLTADNPGQRVALQRLVPFIAQKLAWSEQCVELRRTEGMSAAITLVESGDGKRLMDEIRDGIEAMDARERSLFEQRMAQARRDAFRALMVLVVGLIFDAVLVGAIILVLRRDARAREAANAELRRKSTEIRDLYDRAPCGYHSLDAEGRIVLMNATALSWLGYEHDEVVGRLGLVDLLTPESQLRFAASYPVFLEHGEVRDREYELRRKDGTTFPVIINATAVRDAAGRFLHSRTTIFDLTERKRAEQETQRAREYAESIVETVREPLIILTQDLAVNSANRAYYEMFKTDASQVVGRPLAQLGAGEWALPDLLSTLRSIVPAQARLDACEVTFNFASIGRKILRLNARKLYRPGNHTSLLLLAIEDVSAARQVEQMHLQFRALFESLPGLYLVLTPELIIAAVSDAYLKATMTTRDGILGRGLFEVFPDDPQDATADGAANLRASLARVVQNAAPDTMAIQRYSVQRPDGVFEERYWSPVNSPVLGADGKIVYIIHRVEDVTDFIRQKSDSRQGGAVHGLQGRVQQMEAEIYQRSQEVQRVLGQLRAANAELEAFSYSVSHDLRAPLRHIEGFSGMLEKHAATSLDERGKRYLTVIADSARRMGVLIDDLLTFARIGRTELRRLPVSLEEIVQEVRQSLASEIGPRVVEWEVRPLPVVQGDPNLLRQVLANLIGNAVKYTGRRPVARIGIAATLSAADAGQPAECVVSIRDNGAGFDMKYVAKLFGVFQRLHTTSEFDGTGVGLANVRRIIQRHGGRTWAEGVPGEGAVFYFSLPVEPVPAVPPNPSINLS
jgi:PAS domain S-box-containing protein